MGVVTLVLCLCAISWPHTSSHVCGMQSFTLGSAHSHHARPCLHQGTCRDDCVTPRGPISCQRSPIRPCPTLTVRLLCISPIQPAPLCYLHRLTFLLLRPDQTSISLTGKPPTVPQIFPCPHLFGPLHPLTGPSSIVLHILCWGAIFNL